MRRIWIPLLILVSAGPALAGTFPETMEKPVTDSIAIRQEAQKELDAWGAERQALKEEYRALEKQVAEQSQNRDALEKVVSALAAEVGEKERRLTEARRMAAEMAPFLEKAFARLDQLIEESDPFLPGERRVRRDRLKETLESPSVPVGEKYRKTMEALFVEAEYGNTVEVSRAEISVEGTPLRVNVLRFGRLALFCQTLDETGYGVFDPVSGQWRWLPARYAPGLSRAFSMAGKRLLPDIVDLPLGKVAAQ